LRLSNQQLIRHILLFLWLVLTIYGTLHHVYWRDEVRALSIATSANSMISLPSFLLNEGHPFLWYAVLRIGYFFIGTTAILPIASFLFALGFVWLLLYKSPFHWLFVAVIIFGLYGLHEYNINARNYGIAAFLMFLFAWFARHKKPRFWGYLFLLLLTQTNFYAMIMAGILASLYFLQTSLPYFNRENATKNKIDWKGFVGLMVVFAGCLFCVFTCLPTKDSLVIAPTHFADFNYSKIWDVGWGFPDLFSGEFNFKHGFYTFVLLLCLLTFVRLPLTMLGVFITMMFMAFFHINLRYNFLHHQGMWLFTFITIVWWNYDEIMEGLRKNILFKTTTLIGVTAFTLIMIGFLRRGIQTYGVNLKEPYSNSKEIGTYLTKVDNPNVVIIAEPDYNMESVIYYYNKPFYLMREGTFKKYAHFTTANQRYLEFSDILSKYDSFEKNGKTPIIVMGLSIPKQAATFMHSYNKTLSLSQKALDSFHNEFEEVAHFDKYKRNDEVYYVYRKKIKK